MEGIKRKPFQGVTNIIRFNWHYYAIAFVMVVLLFISKSFIPASFNVIITILVILMTASILVSLAVSMYIYDYSNLYTLDWLDRFEISSDKKIVNINAGFDETSTIVKQKFRTTNLTVFDFYDPMLHTEISIERARKAYPHFPGTILISTNNVPLEAGGTDYVFLILSAHEIRNQKERNIFFKQLSNTLSREGKIIVVEHQRDFNNFMAYNFGFFHFYPTKTWKKTFDSANLITESTLKITPFISAFVLIQNGTTS